MVTRSNWESRRLAAAALIGCMVTGSVLGLIDNRLAMGERLEYEYANSPWQSMPAATEDEYATADDSYVAVSAWTNYQAVTNEIGSRFTYTVEPGDSLWYIANLYDTDISTLFGLNPELEGTVIQPGQELQVMPGFRGLTHTVEWGESLDRIASLYDMPLSDIVEANHLDSSGALQAGQELLIPGAEARPERHMVASARGGASRRTSGQAGWIWPITGGLHSSEFGEPRWGSPHTGLDIAVATGTPAHAVAAGTVVFSGWDGGFGYMVTIDHGGGIQTRYAHASKLLVSEGDWVAQGQEIILVGATGNSTGPHLHLEVLVDGEAQNPRNYLP